MFGNIVEMNKASSPFERFTDANGLPLGVSEKPGAICGKKMTGVFLAMVVLVLAVVSPARGEGEVASVFDFMTAAEIADVRAGSASFNVAKAIQDALTASASRTVVFPPGKYRIDFGLNVLDDGTVLVGDGATILNHIPGRDHVFYVNASNVAIRNFTIENRPNNVEWRHIGHLGSTICVTPMPKGVLNRATDPPIHNILIENMIIHDSVHGRFAFSVRGRVHGCSMKNIVINANGANDRTYKAGFSVEHAGKGVQPRDVSIENVQIYGLKNMSYGFYLSGVVNGDVNNAYVEGAPHVGAYLYVGENGAPLADSACTFRNSTFRDVGGDCFAIAGHAQPRLAPMRKTCFKIHNNRIYGDPDDPGATGVRVFSSGGGLEISQNIFKSLALGVHATHTHGMVVDNNLFDDITHHARNPVSGRAVNLDGTDSSNGVCESCISNNIFEHSDKMGLQVSYSSRNVIANNSFRDVFNDGSTSSDHPGVNVRLCASDNVISGNTFGYDNQSSPPWRWISIETVTSEGKGICLCNKILNNTFYPSGSAASSCPAAILNGAAACDYKLITIIQNNTRVGGLGGEKICVGAVPCTLHGNNYEFYGATAAPTVGTWSVGDRVVRVPEVGQPKAWSCTAGGMPGTWTSEGNL